jgi:serine/threonine protein kinase
MIVSRMDDERPLGLIEHDDGYEVIRTLARGESGITELVQRRIIAPGRQDIVRPGRLLVRKRIPAALSNREAWEKARACAEPLLARIVDIYELPEWLVVVYEYIPGESLARMVEDAGGISPALACDVALDVCRCASALHARGIVHRDITPGNIIVSADGSHLVDLGIARVTGAETDYGGAYRQHDTTTLGTFGFAAPEQFGFAQTDERSDIYSIGRLIAYMVSGSMPKDGSIEAALTVLDAEAPVLARVVRKACSFDRSARYTSADELGNALRGTCDAMTRTSAVTHAGHESSRADSTDGRTQMHPPEPARSASVGLDDGSSSDSLGQGEGIKAGADHLSGSTSSRSWSGYLLVTPRSLRRGFDSSTSLRCTLAVLVILLLSLAPVIVVACGFLQGVARGTTGIALTKKTLESVLFWLVWLYAFGIEAPASILRVGPYDGNGSHVLLTLVRVILIPLIVYVIFSTLLETLFAAVGVDI